MINEECGTGSTGRICTDIAAALESDGNEVKIAFGRNADIVPAQYSKYAVRIGNDIDLKIHGLITRAFDATGFGSMRATRKFIHWIYQFNPDIIHLHNLHGYYINIDLLFSCLKQLNKPVVWTLHDVWPFTGHSAYCDAVGCSKWKNGCENCPQMKVYPKSYVDRSKRNWERKRNIFCGVTNLTIVTPSKWLAELVEDSFLNEYPVKVINNGIDTGKFHKVSTHLRSNLRLQRKKILLSVATVWNDLKGLSDFEQLADLLGENYKIILVGGMTNSQEKELPESILHIRRTQDVNEMVELYNTADIYLNLTYCDTYPTVNLEAASCGTPVITYAVGGSTESAEMFGGISVRRGDVEAVAHAVREGERLKVVIPADYDLDKKCAIKEYIGLYRGVL
jgi:putative colanic acid biosynthesis glycosyltransferase